MVSDSINVAQNSMEEANPKSVSSEQGRDTEKTILNAARNCMLESFNFQKWVIENITSIQSKQRDLEYKVHNLINDTNSGKKSVEVETSEVEDEIEMQDWSEKDLIKGDVKHLEDVIRIVKDKTEVDNEIIINRVAKTKKALKNFMNHNLEVLRILSQNMNALVDYLERKNQNKDMVIIDDMLTTSSSPQISRRRTT